ncbi:hypothetical protein HPB49_008065 [Dermacentor silvarum]|uniref:Uncharacterized protein n=1 Tax=Dermacentor silvarum TaxID=543639 RepID=A0ACB8CE22_DERSI|nr:hypothetical protein HPB49_008065 [Dermacentor silvarum]
MAAATYDPQYAMRGSRMRSVALTCEGSHALARGVDEHSLTPLRGPQLSRLYKYYATITWTVHDRLLKNLIDRSTLSTVKNDGPVKVFKIAINQLERLRSDNGKFVFECTALSTRRSPRQPSRLVPCSRTPARATPSVSLAGPRAARAATSTSHPSP